MLKEKRNCCDSVLSYVTIHKFPSSINVRLNVYTNFIASQQQSHNSQLLRSINLVDHNNSISIFNEVNKTDSWIIVIYCTSQRLYSAISFDLENRKKYVLHMQKSCYAYFTFIFAETIAIFYTVHLHDFITKRSLS